MVQSLVRYLLEAGQVEGHREPVLPGLEQVLVAGVRVGRGSEARELAHGPELGAVHARVGSARVRELTGPADVAREVDAREVGRRGKRRHRLAAHGLEARVALTGLLAG